MTIESINGGLPAQTPPGQVRAPEAGRWQLTLLKNGLPNREIDYLLPMVALLWLGYLLGMIVVDHYAAYTQPTIPTMPAIYYGLHIVLALAVFAWSRWQSGQAQLGRFFLPIAISWMSVGPSSITALMRTTYQTGPLTSVESLGLRHFPILLMALLIVAWQYRWREVVVFCLSLTAIRFFGIFVYHPTWPMVAPAVLVTLIQMISFLVVGYAVCALIERLRSQAASLAQANQQLHHYATTLEELAISRERNRMARELHDTLAHTLSGLTVQMEAIKAYWDVDPQTAKALQLQALAVARTGQQETRRALKALRATPLENLGLSGAIGELSTSAAATAQLQLTLTLPPTLPILAPDIEQAVYRIAQEAITNVTQHANARQLLIELSYTDQLLVLIVQDNGCGFDAQLVPAGHFGVTGMHERAQLAGGQLTLTSSPGSGTRVQLGIAGAYAPPPAGFAAK